MPNTFSKPIAHETSPMRRTYEERISFIAQAEKASSIKPKEIKVKLRQDPTDPNSDEVSKTFTEFVGTSPEAYCQWMCWRKQFYDQMESTQDSIVSATAPAIFYVGYGLPFKVFYYGFQPLCSLLSSSSQYSRLSIESEIRSLSITNLHRSSLLTSFVFSTFLI
jgi:hypothetical protein